MITSRGLVERNPLTFRMIAFDGDEHPRSMQLYGVDPVAMGRAVRMVVERDLADHIDMNFGCPVPKVTRRGGGAALPYKRRLFEEIVRAAVANADGRPVTVKMRIGIDDERHTYLDAARRAADAGVAAVALHARTAAQRYSGQADWSAIARLRDALPAELPVLGNGDIFSAADALRMVATDRLRRRRRRAGVPRAAVALRRPGGRVRRTTVARPAEPRAGHGRPCAATPSCSASTWARTRASATCASTSPGTSRASRWGRTSAGGWASSRASTSWTSCWPGSIPYLAFPDDADAPRGRQGSPGRVVLPEGWLDDPDDAAVPLGAELEHSGG